MIDTEIFQFGPQRAEKIGFEVSNLMSEKKTKSIFHQTQFAFGISRNETPCTFEYPSVRKYLMTGSF